MLQIDWKKKYFGTNIFKMVSENNYLLNPIIHYVQFYYPLDVILLEQLTYLKIFLHYQSTQHVVQCHMNYYVRRKWLILSFVKKSSALAFFTKSSNRAHTYPLDASSSFQQCTRTLTQCQYAYRTDTVRVRTVLKHHISFALPL